MLDWPNALGLAPRTVENHLGALANFLNWCGRRRFVKDVPTASIAEADMPQVKPKPKGVLTVDQTATMMEYLDCYEPKYAPWHALQLFAGIRRAEVGRMDWGWIDLDAETITLPGWTEEGDRIVKTGDDWVLHGLPPNPWAWLRKHRDEGRIKVPGNDTVERLRNGAFPVLSAPIPKWPKNAMRHTFCTMLMSLHGDAAKVANWTARSSSTRATWRHSSARRRQSDSAGSNHPVKAPSASVPSVAHRA